MFFFLYSLFILQISDYVQSTRISFVDIIPSLIVKRQIISEYIFNNSISYNQTYPKINIDESLYRNRTQCSQDIQILFRDLLLNRLWALKTFDAWGKLPNGFLQGNIYWLGSAYECQNYLHGIDNTIISQPFQTHTCTIQYEISDRIGPVYGMCVPVSCKANDIMDIINRDIIKIPFIKDFIHLTTSNIHCIEDRSLSSSAIITLILILLVICFIVIATGVDIFYSKPCNIKITNKYLKDRFQIDFNRIIIDLTNKCDGSVSSSVETMPLIPKSAQNLCSKILIKGCSLRNNYNIFNHENYPPKFACLNGIRVLSLCWVIFGHGALLALYYSDNALIAFNWSRTIWAQLIIQGSFSIDTFFVLSGLLTAFTYFISKTENENSSIFQLILNHYIYHYLRYTPLYAFILLIYITLSPYLGQNGPLYPIEGIESSNCQRTWWRNLLYINNFFDIRDGCMPITWFLATNMQFHWITPLFFLFVSWQWLLGVLVSIILITVDIMSTSIIVSKNNYDHGLLSDLYSNKSNWLNMTHGYINDVYIKPWSRISPYAIGLSIGYIFYEVYQRSNPLARESRMPRKIIYSSFHYIKRIFAWTLAIIILSLCIFGTYGDYNGQPLTRENRIRFLMLSRVGWSIGLCIIIITCFAGQGGPVNKFLSCSLFYKLSKLTYGAFLWHTLVIFVDCFAREKPIHLTISNMLNNVLCYTILSYVLSFITFLFIELPLIQMLKSSFKRSTNFV